MSAAPGRREQTLAWGLAAVAAALAVGGSLLNLYGRIAFYDEVTHAYNFFALTLLVAVYAYGVVLTGAREHAVLVVLVIAAIGLALGAVWEIAEWSYDHFIAKPEVILPKTDTIVDMILDTAGALVAGTVRVWMLRK